MSEDDSDSRIERIKNVLGSSNTVEKAIERLGMDKGTSSQNSSGVVADSNSIDWIFEMGAGGVKGSDNNGSSRQHMTRSNAGADSLLFPTNPYPSNAAVLSVADKKAVEKAMERARQKKKSEEERVEREKREKFKAMFFEKMKHKKAGDLVQGIKTFVVQFNESHPQMSRERLMLYAIFCRCRKRRSEITAFGALLQTKSWTKCQSLWRGLSCPRYTG